MQGIISNLERAIGKFELAAKDSKKRNRLKLERQNLCDEISQEKDQEEKRKIIMSKNEKSMTSKGRKCHCKDIENEKEHGKTGR